MMALDSNQSSCTAEWQLTSLTPTKGKQEEEQLFIYLLIYQRPRQTANMYQPKAVGHMPGYGMCSCWPGALETFVSNS